MSKLEKIPFAAHDNGKFNASNRSAIGKTVKYFFELKSLLEGKPLTSICKNANNTHTHAKGTLKQKVIIANYC